jgi:hypothetical protein
MPQAYNCDTEMLQGPLSWWGLEQIWWGGGLCLGLTWSLLGQASFLAHVFRVE